MLNKDFFVEHSPDCSGTAAKRRYSEKPGTEAENSTVADASGITIFAAALPPFHFSSL